MKVCSKGLIFLAILPLIVSCSYHMTPTLSNSDLVAIGISPIPRKVLILVPSEFDEFIYVSSYEGREIRYEFGAAIHEQFRTLMDTVFTTSIFRSVSSQAAAVMFITSENPDLHQFDYVGIPSFVNVNSWVKPFQYGTELTLKVEFFSKDKTKVISINGRGQGHAGMYIGPALENAGRAALKSALNWLKADLKAKRGMF